MCCLRLDLSHSIICKAHSWRGYSPCCSLPNAAGLQIVSSRRKNEQLLTLCLLGHSDLLPAIWVTESQLQYQILFFARKFFISESLAHSGPSTAVVILTKLQHTSKLLFSLIQVCRIVLLSTNMSYVHGLIPRSAEQTQSMLPTKGVEKARQLEI